MIKPMSSSRIASNRQFRIFDILCAVAYISIFLAFRTWWVESKNDEVIYLAATVMAILAGMGTGWASCTNWQIFIVTCFATFATSTSFALECVFHSPASTFDRPLRSAAYYDLPIMNVFSVATQTTALSIVGGIFGLAIRRLKQPILDFKYEIKMAAIFGLIGTALTYEANHFFIGHKCNITYLVGGFTIGVILGASLGYTRNRFHDKEKQNDVE